MSPKNNKNTLELITHPPSFIADRLHLAEAIQARHLEEIRNIEHACHELDCKFFAPDNINIGKLQSLAKYLPRLFLGYDELIQTCESNFKTRHPLFLQTFYLRAQEIRREDPLVYQQNPQLGSLISQLEEMDVALGTAFAKEYIFRPSLPKTSQIPFAFFAPENSIKGPEATSPLLEYNVRFLWQKYLSHKKLLKTVSVTEEKIQTELAYYFFDLAINTPKHQAAYLLLTTNDEPAFVENWEVLLFYLAELCMDIENGEKFAIALFKISEYYNTQVNYHMSLSSQQTIIKNLFLRLTELEYVDAASYEIALAGLRQFIEKGFNLETENLVSRLLNPEESAGSLYDSSIQPSPDDSPRTQTRPPSLNPQAAPFRWPGK